MDVFALRNQLIRDYAAYIESFINVSDERIREHVDRELREGLARPSAARRFLVLGLPSWVVSAPEIATAPTGY